MFGKTVFWIAVTFLGLPLFLHVARVMPFWRPGMGWHLLATGIALTMWRWPLRPTLRASMLMALDTVGTLGMCVSLAIPSLTSSATVTALATLASKVIYGLQERVFEARRLGQYTLEEKIGAGGMGEVYRASHAMLRRPTAVKLMSGEVDEEQLRRFEREVQLTARLNHPNTISIYDYGRTPDGTFYYAMELLAGLTLEQLVQRHGPQPPRRVIHILQQVCGALREAHDAGLIHRDIKPANAILCQHGGLPDVVKVLDFGLVKQLASSPEPSLSNASAIVGTPLFMSPEEISTPASVGPCSDLATRHGGEVLP